MYRASMYDKHDTSMKKFVDLFNNSSAYPNLTMSQSLRKLFSMMGILLTLLPTKALVLIRNIGINTFKWKVSVFHTRTI